MQSWFIAVEQLLLREVGVGVRSEFEYQLCHEPWASGQGNQSN